MATDPGAAALNQKSGSVTERRRHEVRDHDGRLIAVIDEIIGKGEPTPTTIELAADIGGTAYRVRIFPAIAEQRRAA